MTARLLTFSIGTEWERGSQSSFSRSRDRRSRAVCEWQRNRPCIACETADRARVKPLGTHEVLCVWSRGPACMPLSNCALNKNL